MSTENVSCSKCEAQLAESSLFCSQCGHEIAKKEIVENVSHNSTTTHIRSNWWYLVPLLMVIPGGIVAYFAVRKDDPRLAKNCIIVGVIMSAIMGILSFVGLI